MQTVRPQRKSLAVAISSAMLALGLASDARAGFPAIMQLSDLNGANGVRIDGETAGDRSGLSVSDIGDINGDGISDLIIGARFASPNGNESGSSYVMFGRNTASEGKFPTSLDLADLDGSNGFRIDGAADGDHSGFSVSGAGDINGDGIDDLVLGAPYADPNGDDSGISYVVFGRNTATDGAFPAILDLGALFPSTGFRIDGAEAQDVAGVSVSAAGDVNGDGIDDLIVGAVLADHNGDLSGSSYVVFGRDTAITGAFPASLNLGNLDGSNGFRLDGEAAYDRSGYAVSSAGDINGDGIADLLIGAPAASPNGNESGRSYVVFGRDTDEDGTFPNPLLLSTLDGTTGFRLNGEAEKDRSGLSLSGAGDINGDGIDDLVVGSYRIFPLGDSHPGSSYVVFGRNTGADGGFPATLQLSALDGVIGFRLDGAADGDAAGYRVSRAGDINGNGIHDLIVGAPYADPNGSNSGSSFVIFGRDTETSENFPSVLELSSLQGTTGFRIDGAAEGDVSGGRVSSAGDFNGDGIDDVIISAPGTDHNGDASGSTYVIFGRGDALFSDRFEVD